MVDLSISKNLRIVELSDIHLGHPKTSTRHIVNSLNSLLPDNSVTSTIDLIIIAGDVFDRQLTVDDPNVTIIERWIARLLRLCVKHDIVLRVLEGTPSHDWCQSRLFIDINEMSEIGCDVQYFNALTVEYIDKFDIHVLYIPDEYRPTCDETWVEVVKCLEAKSLDKVDYTVMHGGFPHQFPEHLRTILELHNPERYLGITKHYVFVGHIHLKSHYSRILSAGSTDRLCHGEEKPKGMWMVDVSQHGDTITFVENTWAKKYVTVDCTGLDVTSAHGKIEKVLKRLPHDSAVRVKGSRSEAILSSGRSLSALYPNISWSFQDSDKVTKATTTLGVVDNRSNLMTMSLTPVNLQTLLMDRIRQKYPDLGTLSGELLEAICNE